MLNCRETRRWLSPYLDSELEQTKTFEVSEHLRVCPACAERFEQERLAEQLFREAINREAMPDALWNRIKQDVATPAWVRALHRSRKTLALAAAITLAVIIWQAIPDRSAKASPSWIVERFVAETPADRAFTGQPLTPAYVSDFLTQQLGIAWSVSPDAIEKAGHFGFEIVSTRRRTDPSGRAYVEVRLNCCGQPILMALLEADAASDADLLTPGALTRGAPPDLNVAVRQVGSVVAVAVSRHELDGMLDGVHPSRG